MANMLGINAVFDDPAAALMIDGSTVAAAEEERFSRRNHGKTAVPFSTWELPERAIEWCLCSAGLDAAELDAVANSCDPAPASGRRPGGDPSDPEWEHLRTLFTERAASFVDTVLPGRRGRPVHHVAHHVAHAASAWGAHRSTRAR